MAKILIVDDEVQLIEMLQIRLEANGYEIVSAKDGREGVEKVKSENPDLIILDISVPDGSGFDVLRWIARRKRLRDIPVIVFTASTDPEHARLAEEFGVRRFLQKPADFGDLVAAIKEELPGEDAWQDPESGQRPETRRVPPR